MKDLIPAKISVCCFLFLAVLYITGAVDFSLAALLVLLIIVFKQPAVYLFLSAFFSFILYLTFVFFGLRLDVFADLSVTSYILFTTGLVLYFLQGQQNQWLLNLPLVKHVAVSKSHLWKFGGILILTLLIYPLTGVSLALVIAYFIFLLVFHRFSDGRYAFVVALFFLLLCPLLLIGKKEKIAETAAIFTYYFLVIGVVQEIIDIIRNPAKADDGLSHRQTVLQRKALMQTYPIDETDNFREKIKSFPKVFVIGITVFVLSFMGVLFLPKILMQKDFLIGSVGGRIKSPLGSSPAPTIVSSDRLLPSPTLTLDRLKDKIASSTFSLNLSVENGTTISGLAASTAARLKEAGFNKITIGNAVKTDYKNWEMTAKTKIDNLADYLKRLLGLTVLNIKEASSSAKYDMVIIIGEKK